MTPTPSALSPSRNALLSYLLRSRGLCLALLFATLLAAPGAWAQTALATVPTGQLPFSVATNPVTGNIYVANFAGSSVTVIDGATDAVLNTIQVGSSPRAIAVDAATNKI